MASPLPIAGYDPSRVIMTLGDITPQAYGPDTRITITPTAGHFSVQQGQDGHIIRIKTRAIHHNLQFVLMKSDPANDLLTELYQDDVASEAPTGIVKFLLTDNNGAAKCTAPYAWISVLPELSYSASGEQTYTWNVTLASADVQTRAMAFIP